MRLRGAYDACTDLQDEEREYLDRVLRSLPLLADIAHADLLLCAKAGDDAVVVGHAAPNPVPSLYPRSQTGQILQRRDRSRVFRVLHEGRDRALASGMLIWGAPTVQEVTPIRTPQ